MEIDLGVSVQYICPECGILVANSATYSPLCHNCDYKVRRIPYKRGIMGPDDSNEILSMLKHIASGDSDRYRRRDAEDILRHIYASNRADQPENLDWDKYRDFVNT